MGSISQAKFEYNGNQLDAIYKYMSPERLSAYMTQARGDRWVAIKLYERNTEISEAIYGLMQGLEVTLRNAIHNRFTKHLGGPDWYEKITLEDSERDAVEEAKKSILERPAIIIPGRVVGELKFGFWVRMFAHNYDKTLWVPHLRNIFPVRLGNSRSMIHGRLVELKTLRNRIAHHERIAVDRRDLEKDYTEILETVEWISPDVRQWLESTNCFRERMDKRLPKKPKPEPVISSPDGEPPIIPSAVKINKVDGPSEESPPQRRDS